MKYVNIKFDTFLNKDHYMDFQAAWKAHYHKMQALKKDCKDPGFADAVQHLLYAVLRGRDVKKVFHTDDKFYEVMGQLMVQLRYGNVKYLGIPFGDTLTKEMLLQLHDLMLGREKAA